jgi:putative glycosyltransferase
MLKISIVTSLYKSAAFIEDFYRLHLESISKLGVRYEFIFVDDGSPDESIGKVKVLAKTDKNVRLIVLSRNFGQYPAMFAGMSLATGDFIYTSDSDLEESPHNIEHMWEIIQMDKSLDVVFGVMKKRTGGILRHYFGKLFFDLLHHLSESPIQRNQTWQRLMSKRYVDALLCFKEIDTSPIGIMTLTGFKQMPLLYERKYKGYSSYNFAKRLNQAINGLTAFSSLPLVYIAILGFVITLFAFSGVVIVIFQKMFIHSFQAGWPSLIVSIWLVGGLIISSLGVIGIYLSKVFNQVKNRPLYIVKEIIGG